jgi:hypothetical protein
MGTREQAAQILFGWIRFPRVSVALFRKAGSVRDKESRNRAFCIVAVRTDVLFSATAIRPSLPPFEFPQPPVKRTRTLKESV